ncbi:WD-40 repeat protein (plasmid) [Anabaenopsis circularis NIES-21]|uniref:WD-40 repeat protein n=1 Tax=Anabaenopsis circularis NIES-21 TaxID=1085406 RepID=A0A1Z4GRV5_9CYAN|nr:WD-40 repeat protein [Anabaenopsis circularis NIES-21]
MAKINRSLAIVIGIDKYEHIPKLKNAVSDAAELASVLKDIYGYEVLLLLNKRATKEKLDELVTNLKNKTIQFDRQQIQVEPSDRVLFYFAGHGFSQKPGDKDIEDGKPSGYFMPQNAEDSNPNTWLSMQEVYKVFTDLDCHHLLMILDCCFAGSIYWAGDGRNAARSNNKLYQQHYDHFTKNKTQQIITSAAHDEEAQDSFRYGQRGDRDGNSPFAHFLLKVLRPNPDGGNDKFIEGIIDDKVITVHELFAYLQNQLGKVAEGQTPALSKPRKHDQQTGKYVFLKGEYVFLLGNFKYQDLIHLKLDESTNPYKSLASFENKKEDIQLFFGRKKLIEDPKEGLGLKVSDHLLTVVLGTSGSGKSSLVKAGLIPALESSQQKWVILESMRPGESPLSALNKILTQLGSASSTILSLSYQEKRQIICNKIENLIYPDSKLLLVIDQSEELLTLCQNQEERTDFINLLDQLLTTYQQQLRIVLTLRSEFEPQIRDAIKETHWQQVWQDGRFIVTPMDREELQLAIEEPAAQRALFFESPKLVNDLINEVAQMPGSLPLLSFTLSQLYLKYLEAEEKLERNDRTITEADYQEIGGVTRSLTQTADKTYNKLVEEEVDEQTKKACELTIRDVMLRMVAISAGERARRRVLTSELEYPGLKNEQAKKVIDRFIEARLLVKGLEAEGQEYVEPVHDALIIGWEKIKYWFDEKQDIVKQEQGSGWKPIKKLLTVIKVSLPLTSKEKGTKSDRPEAEQQLKVNLPLQREVNTSANNWCSKKDTDGRAKAVGFLWNADPRLDLLKQVLKSEDNWFNQVEAEFVQRSVGRKDFNTKRNWGFVIAVMVGLSGFTIAVLIQWRSSQLNLAESDGRYSLSLLNEHKDLEAFVQAIKAGKILQSQHTTSPYVLNALQEVLVEGREKNRLQGHENFVTSVSFSRDGKTLASGSYDKTIKLWDLETGQFRTLKGHNAAVTSVSFSPNGKTLASGSDDGTIKLWNLETGKEIPTHMEHDSSVTSVSFSPNGKTLASGSDGGTIKLWDLKTGQFRTLKAYDIHSAVTSVSFSPNGKTLASLSNDGTIKLWNVETAKAILTPKRQGNDIHDMSMSFSPDGKTLAYGSEDKTIKLWNLETGKEIPTLMKHDGPVQSVSFSPDGKTLAASSDQGTIKLWNPKTGIEIPTHMKHDQRVNSVSFSPDSKTLASGSADYTIKIWDLEPGTEIPTLTGNKESFQSVSFSPDGKTLASGSNDKTIKLWNPETRKEIHTLQTGDYSVKSVSFSPDGKTLASLSNDGTIKLWNVETRKEIPKKIPLPLPSGYNNLVESVSFSPKGMTLAFGLYGKVIKLWNLETGEIRILQKQENNPVDVNSVSFSHDGKTLASGNSHERGGTDNTIQLWNVETGKEIYTLPGHNDDVNSVSFSPDGKILASGSDDKTIKLWNVETGKEIYTLSGHDDPVKSVSFSPDGNTLASGSGLVAEPSPGTDNTIKLWNVETRTEIRTLKGHNDAVTSLSFSPDGKTLASGSNDKTIKLWHLPDLEVEPLLERSCAFVGAYLANPNSGMSKDDSDRHLCEGIGTPEQTQKISTGETTPVSNPKSPVLKADVKPLDPKAAKEISELKGHQGQVRSVAFSRDGQTLATSGEDGTIRLWNAQGKFLSQFQGNQTAIRSIDFSPDGQKLVSDAGGKIRLWDLHGKLLKEFDGQQKLIRSVKFNPTKPQLASTGDDGFIHLWDLDGKSLGKWQADPKRVWDLAFSPDGQQIASAEAGGSVSLWNWKGQPMKKLTGHISPVLSVAFSPDSKQLVSGCNVGMIRSWSLPDYQMTNMFQVVNQAELNSVAYSLDGKLIVTGDNKGDIKMWKVNNQQSSPFWTAHQNSIIRKVAFSPDGNMLATAADDGIVKLWQLD